MTIKSTAAVIKSIQFFVALVLFVVVVFVVFLLYRSLNYVCTHRQMSKTDNKLSDSYYILKTI